ncbi:hypothetical protein ILYODFUR_034465 [Ilyodon furcidens]|uniref:Uncharacterized protein n=1 Tax=Ilyodon furcidens TaxID=33524 RepID=A0ABV0VMF6_9TELE
MRRRTHAELTVLERKEKKKKKLACPNKWAGSFKHCSPIYWDKASPVLQAVSFSLMEVLKVSPYWTVFYLALGLMELTSADASFFFFFFGKPT